MQVNENPMAAANGQDQNNLDDFDRPRVKYVCGGKYSLSLKSTQSF